MQIKTNSIVDVVYRILVKEGNVAPVCRYSLLIIGVAVIFLISRSGIRVGFFI